jgi:sugar fermentation stimulation protein A
LKLVKGRFKKRLNRFAALVNVEGVEVECHLPNPGRLLELLQPEAEVYLEPAGKIGRKTMWTLKTVRLKNFSAPLDAREANRLFRKALLQGTLPEFSAYRKVKEEVKVKGRRIDFLLHGPFGRCFVEVKSCTLVMGEVALFPDAPTRRGLKHLNILVELIRRGSRAAVVFMVQRPDAQLFKPNDLTDPKFANTLRAVAQAGLNVYAYKLADEREKPVRIPVNLKESLL